MKNKNLIATLSSILIAVIAAFCASPSYAAISAYEPFNYSTGSLTTGASTATGAAGLTTAGGFTGNWSGNGTIVAGLSYSGLSVANNALSENAQNQIVSLAAPVTNGTYYVGFLFTQNTTANSGNNGGNGGALDLVDSTGKGIAIGQLGPDIQTAGNFEVCPVTGKTAAGTAKYTGFGNDTYGTTYLIVVEITGTGSGWSGSIWINPPTGTASPGTPTGTFSGISQFTFGAIAMWNAGGGNADVFDEIRVGTTYGDAVGFATAPANPTGVSAVGGTSQVALNWAAVAGATSYNVLQGTSSGSESSIATGVTGTSYTDTTTANGTQYFYEIQALNAVGTSGNSTETNATPMAAPTGLNATAGNNSAILSWTAPSGGGQTGYNVKRSTTSGGSYTNISTAGAVTGTAYTDNGVVAGTTYYYVVSATNIVGESSISTQASTTPFSQPPTAPTGLLTVPTNSQVTLSWTAGTGDVSYNVKRSTTSGSGYATISTTGTVTGTGYTDATAVNGNIYYYVVSGTNSSGESVNSTQSSAALPPAAPTGLGATAGANQIVLNWTASSGASGATSYNVKRSTNSGSGYTTISTPGTVTGTAYTDSTAFSGTTYFYVVSGVNATGQGANSIQATTTPSGPPQVPTVTMITNYTSLTLNWAAVAGAPAGYVVSRSTTSGTETVLTNLAATTFTDTNVVIGTEYFYTVAATNSSGSSANSAEVTGTAPGTPFAYESFNYGSISAGTPTTAAGFTGSWTVNGSPNIAGNLTYPNLTTANSAVQSSSAGDNFYENLSTPLSGTVWVSFLFYQTADNGGNRSGLTLLNSSGSGVMFCYHQFQTAIGTPCIDSVSNYNVGTDLRTSGTTQTYAQNNLYVLKLTYTTGTLTSIAVYSNPTAGQNTAPTADFTVTSGLSNVGAITSIGVLNPSGVAITVDEWNVGTTFGSVVPGANVTAPAAPMGVTATPGDDKVTLNWIASAGATTYNVLQGTASGTETTIATGVTSQNYTDTTALNGTKYYYVVQAANSAGPSGNSAEVSATPVAPPIPGAPTGVTATPGNNSISLSWNNVAVASSYNVLQGTSSGGETTLATGVTGTNYVDTSTAVGTTYFYVIQAVNDSGTSPNSAEVSGTPVSLIPLPPTGLIITPGNNSISLSWTASAGATGYNVLQGTSSGGESALIFGQPGTNYLDTSVANGTQYFYVVQAVNDFGTSANSAEVSTTAGAAPSPLIGPVQLSSGRTSLVINVPTSTGFNYYLLTTTNLTPPAVWSTNNVTAGTGGTITDTVPVGPLPHVFIRYLVQ